MLMKYMMGLIKLLFTNIRFFIIKLFNYSSFSFSFFNLFSFNTQIEIGKKSFLSLGRGIRARSGIKLKVRDGAQIIIGNNTFFNYNNMLVSHQKISIGENCQFGPNVLIYDHDHDYRTENGITDMKFKTETVEIGNNVWIGANVIILRGTNIGDNCVIGAGTVLKGNYQKDTLIVEERKIKTKKI